MAFGELDIDGEDVRESREAVSDALPLRSRQEQRSVVRRSGRLNHTEKDAVCAELRRKGVTFPVELKKGVNGSLLCYVAAPDGVSIELMQC